MTEVNDMELVQNYSREGSEEAFAELVRRHVSLVYSAALRQVGVAAQAEEITQVVFIILARKAGGLRPDTILAGWLCETTRLTSLSFLRGERRRQFREQEAYMQSTVQESTDPPAWNQLAPLLDEALARLGKKDRDAVVLRFFQEKNLGEVALALRMTEAAAQSRVHRAVGKLRKFFAQRGVLVPAAVLTAAISANSVQAAPVTLAKSVTIAALAKGAATSGSTLALMKGALKLMTWTKTKTAAVAIVLAIGTGVIVVDKIMPPATPFIRIAGKGQVELYTLRSNQTSRVVATARLVILTDGKSWRMSVDSAATDKGANNPNDLKAEYGCDGTDIFVLSDQHSPLHRTDDGWGGFAYPGRFPEEVWRAPSVVQAAWLAYCSSDYFNISSNQTGLKLGPWDSLVWRDYVTNLVAYWPDSTLPHEITGWSRDWVIAPRHSSDQIRQALELNHYPNGFKAWKFTASDPAVIGKMRVPRQFTLETFWPQSSPTNMTGADPWQYRKATFTADSIEMGTGRLNPLPPVTVPDLKVVDSRFEDLAGDILITSHASPKGWAVRGSQGFKQATAEAAKLAAETRENVKAYLKQEQTILPPP